MASAETKAEAEVAIRIEAKPETVFDFFTDPDKMIQWMGRKAELEPRAGGIFRCDINGESVARGEYVELDPPRRVVFTWGWEGEDSVTPPGSSTVEILLEPDGAGTRMRLVHRDLPSAESAERHGHGWNHYAERLAAAASGRDAGPDPWATPGGADADTTDLHTTDERTQEMGNPTMWFEVAGKDREALKGFYSSLFDWQLTDMDAMPYTTVDTGGEGIPGGIGSAPDGDPGHVTFYVRVDDIEAALGKAEGLGATKLMGPMDIPSGQIALIADPEGHRIGLMTQTG